jgi:alpha-1,6-mannosyltransferase
MKTALPRIRVECSRVFSPYRNGLLLGLILLFLHLVLARLSWQFTAGDSLLSQPFVLWLGLELCAGVVWLLGVAVLRRSHFDSTLLYWVLGIGLGLRIILMASTPVLEDDYFRYLWDGAVTAQGLNPYAFSPDEVLIADEFTLLPPVLIQLAQQEGNSLLKVNHGGLRTIYPPTAQAAFALAYWLRPWSLNAWRVVLLGFDLATLGFLVLFLRYLQLSPGNIVIYWWNPLLLKEAYNSAHMDLVVLPFVLGAVWLSVNKRYNLTAICLGLALGAKVWPALLLPVLLRPLFAQPRKLLAPLALFALISGAMFAPIWQAGLNDDSGFAAFMQHWQMNDSFFLLLLWGVNKLGSLVSLDGAMVQATARGIIGLLLISLLLWKVRRPARDAIDLCERCLVIIAALFLLSPVQFPWYALWLLPLLALRPRGSLLLLTVLLPLYYARFYFVARDRVQWFDYGLVWVEYVPVWFLLAWEKFVSPRLALNKV